ncbi:MAG: hypothetical protein L3J58_09995 [Emcibacter sp.]|nr:hypothetical protein [Emcibacter sp.]
MVNEESIGKLRHNTPLAWMLLISVIVVMIFRKCKMQNLSSGKFAIGILTLMTTGIVAGFFNQDPIVVNDFLYRIGIWEYMN